jgi:hypothetical protein
MKLREELQRQRWDDHRFYHRNRINQSLHFFSALCFLSSYVLIFIEPVWAVMIGWLLAMVSRQIGHFFFESKDFDTVNNATHEYKESVKVGYNLRRKVVLLTLWVTSPLILKFDPTVFGMLIAATDRWSLLTNISLIWFWIGVGAIIFRSIHLIFIMGPTAALAWPTKILTDPFHDVYIYAKAPLYLMKGELYDDMSDWYIEEFSEELKEQQA